jgi:hypothetical protein
MKADSGRGTWLARQAEKCTTEAHDVEKQNGCRESGLRTRTPRPFLTAIRSGFPYFEEG